jgi:hypothetical protein
LGNKQYAKKSETKYIKEHGKALWLWMARIGDYDSMLMLVTPILQGVPAMKLETVTSYMRFKKLPKGTDCTKTLDGEEVIDTDTKKVIKCCGKWTCNSGIKVFGSAVSRFHKCRDHTGKYLEVCDKCVELRKTDKSSNGCRSHENQESRLFRRGNITESVHFTDCMAGLIDGTYHSQGNDALRPRDVRACGNFLLGAANLAWLGAYVLILIAVRLFLRSDEIVPLQVCDFIRTLFIRKNGRIHSLALKIKGKKDDDWKYYWLWMDEDYPSICPVRHLLIYVYLANIKEGYLFPTSKELSNPPDDGNYVTNLCRVSFMKWFKGLLIKVLPKRGEFLKVGLHMFRKTGYTFAIWGKGLWEAIKKDARHISDHDAFLYACDAFSAMKVQEVFYDPNNLVGKYSPSIIENPGQMAVDCRQSTVGGMSLLDVATEYVESLQVPEGFRRDMKSLVKAATEDTHGDDSDKLLEEIAEECSPSLYRKLEHYLETKDQERTAAAVARAREAVPYSIPLPDDPELAQFLKLNPDPKASAAGTTGATAAEESAAAKRGANEDSRPAATKKKARKFGTDDLVGREEVADLTSLEEKLDSFCQLSGRCPPCGDLTPQAKTFVMRTLRPVMKCLEVHHRNDHESFCNRWREQFKMKFSEKCCKGLAGKACGDLSKK